MLYANDPVLIADTLEDLKKKLTIWKDNIEAKGLRVNVNKTKLACSKHNSSVKSEPVKWPWAEYLSLAPIFRQNCNHWVHKRCSKIKERLKADQSFKCNACNNNIIIISHDDSEVIIGYDKFEVADSFLYLGDPIGQSAVFSKWKSLQELQKARITIAAGAIYTYLLFLIYILSSSTAK